MPLEPRDRYTEPVFSLQSLKGLVLPITQRLYTGIATLDDALSGGLPLGKIVEVSGSPGSGRSTLALSIGLRCLAFGQAIAWIESGPSFWPLPAIEAGVPLDRLLVLRVSPAERLRAVHLLLSSPGAVTMAIVDLSDAPKRENEKGRGGPEELTALLLAQLHRLTERSSTLLLFLTDRLPDASSSGPLIDIRLHLSLPRRVPEEEFPLPPARVPAGDGRDSAYHRLKKRTAGQAVIARYAPRSSTAASRLRSCAINRALHRVVSRNRSMGRTACAFVPRFELALRARAEPGVWDRCLAVVDWASAPPRLSCVTPAAEALGIRAGQIASRSRARWPELVCLAPDSQLLAQAEREVLVALSTLSPRLDADGRGAFFLGLEGLERLWPQDGELLERLAALLTGLGLSARMAIAESPFVAWVGAQHLTSSAVINAAMGEDLLDRLPLAELDLSEPARELCVLLGLRSAGELRRLPKGALAERLGKEGARLERLCSGETFPLWPTVQKMPRATEVVELDLELALEGLEPLLLALQSLLDRLLAAVAAERKALVELTVRVRLDDRSQVVERFVPERPTLQSARLLDLLRLWLERRPFADRVAGLRLEASRVAAADQSQLSLLRQREEQAAAALDQAIARLSAAFGAGAVLFARLADTYRPEARLRWVNAQAPEAAGRGSSAGPCAGKGMLAAAFTGAPLTLALRRVDPPEPVALREAAFFTRSGQPLQRILQSDGPQKLSGEWWAQGFERSYYWLLLETGEIAWVFRDDLTGAYFLQALAD